MTGYPANKTNTHTVSFKRIVKEDIILSDGLILPTGAYICVVNTSGIGCESEEFDGLRYARKRTSLLETQPADQGEHQGPELKARQTWYSSTDRSHITFGHGRHACPGRFIAAVEMKLVLATLLMRYDMSFGDGGKTRQAEDRRPKNLQVLELGFQDPSVRTYFRKREQGEGVRI